MKSSQHFRSPRRESSHSIPILDLPHPSRSLEVPTSLKSPQLPHISNQPLAPQGFSSVNVVDWATDLIQDLWLVNENQEIEGFGQDKEATVNQEPVDFPIVEVNNGGVPTYTADAKDESFTSSEKSDHTLERYHRSVLDDISHDQITGTNVTTESSTLDSSVLILSTAPLATDTLNNVAATQIETQISLATNGEIVPETQVSIAGQGNTINFSSSEFSLSSYYSEGEGDGTLSEEVV